MVDTDKMWTSNISDRLLLFLTYVFWVFLNFLHQKVLQLRFKVLHYWKDKGRSVSSYDIYKKI